MENDVKDALAVLYIIQSVQKIIEWLIAARIFYSQSPALY